MRFIPTKTHAILDYVVGALLIIVPLFWLDDSAVPRAAIWTPVVIGALTVLQSLFTDYEISISNSISVPAHLSMDGLAGIILAASPWVFGFHETVWVPHLLIGLAAIGAAVTTKLHREGPRRIPRTPVSA